MTIRLVGYGSDNTTSKLQLRSVQSGHFAQPTKPLSMATQKRIREFFRPGQKEDDATRVVRAKTTLPMTAQGEGQKPEGSLRVCPEAEPVRTAAADESVAAEGPGRRPKREVRGKCGLGKPKREVRPKPKAHAGEPVRMAEAEAAVAAEGPGRRQGGSFRACPEAEPLPMAEAEAAVAAEGPGREPGGSFRACPEAEPLPMAEAEAVAPQAPPVTCGSSSEAEEDAAIDVAGQAELQTRLQRASARTKRAVEWCGWQIAPLKAGGWGATCKQHMNQWDLSAKTVCKKEVRHGQGARKLTDDECRCRVKMWLLAGREIDPKRHDARDAHLAVNPRLLPFRSEDDVDREVASVVAPTPPSCSSPSLAVAGVIAPCTPPEVAQRMQTMMENGSLPRTTAEQRRRNRATAGTGYFTPPMYTEAFRAGYLHPNLPPPTHYSWRSREGTWRLVPLGG